MYQVIIFVGIILALVGVGAIAAGAPSWALGLGLGSSLIQSGSIGLVGGFLMVGIGFVLRALNDLSRRIDMISPGALPSARRAAPAAAPMARPMAKREPSPSSRREPPMGAQHDEMDEPSPLGEEPEEDTFEERPRGRAWPPVTDSRPAAEARPNERPRPLAEPRLGERPRGPALDPIPPARGDLPPVEPRRPRFPLDRPQAPETNRPLERAPEPRNPRGNSDTSNTVVRSGIIHGMAYTLYADGSIEAELPIGTVRFASIEELQDHVSRTGDEADVDFANKPN
jgi:hypothetical protein